MAFRNEGGNIMIFGDKSAQIEKYAQKHKSSKLVSLLKDKKKDVRIQAIKALGQVGDDTATNNLIIMLHDPDKDIRMASIQAMGDMGNSVTKTHLQYYIEKETDKELIEAARHAIFAISKKVDPVEERL